MRNFTCPWRQPAEFRVGLSNAKLTFVKPFVNGKPTRYFSMLDVVRRFGDLTRREIVALSFEDEAMRESVRTWDNVSYSDYFVAFREDGLLTYDPHRCVWSKGPNFDVWYDEVVNPYLASQPIVTATQGKVKEETVPESDGLTTESRLQILHEATRIKMQKLIAARNEIEHEIRQVDRVLTAVETIRTFFPIMED